MLKSLSAEFILIFFIIAIVGTYFGLKKLDEFTICRKCHDKGHVEAFLEKIPNKSKDDHYRLIKTRKKIHLNKKEFECLARNVYYEAGVEPYIGKISIAHVTYNRLVNGKWGDTFCKVIHNKDQFSWTSMKKEEPSGENWEESKDAVTAFSKGVRVSHLEKVDHYHATYINPPKWANKMHQKVKIGNHIFYAER